jgi:hypothetical protein
LKSLSIVFLLSITFIAKASDGEIRWGVKGGFTIGSFNSDIGPWKDYMALYLTGNSEPFEIAARGGICGGLVMNYSMSDFFSLYSELLYSPKGSAYERVSRDVMQVSQSGGTRPQKDKVKYALDYIELPLGISMTPHRRFNFKLGIAPAFNVSSRIKSSYWKEDNNDRMNEPPFNNIPGTPVKQEYDKMDFDYAKSVIFSAAFELNYNVSDGYIFVNISQSLGDVYSIEELNGYNMKTRNTVVSIGYTFLLPE